MSPFLPLLLIGAQQTPLLDRIFAAGDKDAFLMLPPETVSGALARELVWTGDGSHLVVLRAALEGGKDDLVRVSMGAPTPPDVLARLRLRQEIVVWSVASHKVRTLVSLPSASTTLGHLRPLAGTDRMLFGTSETISEADGSPERVVEGLSMLAAGTGSVVRVATLERSGRGVYDRVALAPTRSLGLIQRETEDGSRVRFFGADGKPGDWLRTSADRLRFDAAGHAGYVVIAGTKAKPVAKFQTIDPATGKSAALLDAAPSTEDDEEIPVAFSSSALAPARPATREEPLLAAYAISAVVPPGTSVPEVVLRVRGGKPEESGVVTTEGDAPVLSPRLDAIAYVVQGSAVVRPLTWVARSAFERARDDALRTVALSNAKQGVLGLILYAGDNGDALPASSGDLWDTIGPYVKSRDIVDSFHYTFGGGLQTGIKDPANTPLGYVEGPGGRAVAYADGHARWIPNPP